jgi:hypothetical protein
MRPLYKPKAAKIYKFHHSTLRVGIARSRDSNGDNSDIGEISDNLVVILQVAGAYKHTAEPLESADSHRR